MLIVDTSVWIDFLKGDQSTKDVFIPYLKKRHILAVSAVFGELLQGVKNKREHEIITGFWNSLPKIDESALFIRAGELAYRNKLRDYGVGLIDCYILAAALSGDYALWTRDKKLQKVIDQFSF